MARNRNWTTIMHGFAISLSQTYKRQKGCLDQSICYGAGQWTTDDAVSVHGLLWDWVENFPVLRTSRNSTAAGVFCSVGTLPIFDACGWELRKSGTLTLVRKMQRYLYTHTPPPSWICDRASLLVENGCSALWWHGWARGRPQCPGLRFQQTPKRRTWTLLGKDPLAMYR